MKGKNLQPRLLYPARISLRFFFFSMFIDHLEILFGEVPIQVFYWDIFFFFFNRGGRNISHFILINLFIYLFLAVLGPRFCARAFSSCSKRGPLFIAVHGPLTIAASPVAEHRLQTRRLSSCGSRAQSLRGMWDPPRPGLEPVSPALAGRLPTTAPPGKPSHSDLMEKSKALQTSKS